MFKIHTRFFVSKFGNLMHVLYCVHNAHIINTYMAKKLTNSLKGHAYYIYQ